MSKRKKRLRILVAAAVLMTAVGFPAYRAVAILVYDRFIVSTLSFSPNELHDATEPGILKHDLLILKHDLQIRLNDRLLVYMRCRSHHDRKVLPGGYVYLRLNDRLFHNGKGSCSPDNVAIWLPTAEVAELEEDELVSQLLLQGYKEI